MQYGEKKGSVLCCIASEESSVSRFSLRDFDIWYLMLQHDSIENALMA